jgi:molybdopterin molybdotransferase
LLPAAEIAYSFGMIISLPQARAVVDECVKPLAAARCCLADAAGLVLATPVMADRDLPPGHRSAMDGYAFLRGEAPPAPRSLNVRGEIPAGVCPAFSLRPGECARIFTGACIPEGADTVVMQEDTADDGENRVRIQNEPARGANILWQGENARKGAELLRAGVVLSPVQIGLCAAAGCASLDVIPRPRIAVLTTGEELLDVSEAAAAHQTRDSNGPMISALLQAARFVPGAVRRVRDSETAIAEAVTGLLAAADVLLITGGVSVGKYDFVPRALQRLGAVAHLHGVAVRPGKPQLVATLGADKYIFGLPGNPLSVMVGLLEFVLPALRKLSGFAPGDCRPGLRVKVVEAIRGRKGQHHLLPAHLAWTPTGPEAPLIAGHGSADLVSACRASGFVVVPPDAQVTPGEWLDFRPWGPVA